MCLVKRLVSSERLMSHILFCLLVIPCQMDGLSPAYQFLSSCLFPGLCLYIFLKAIQCSAQTSRHWTAENALVCVTSSIFP